MKLIINITVQANYEAVAAGFDESLFLALAPPFPPMQLLRFDGCRTNDIVQVRLAGLVNWVSRIVEHGNNKEAGQIWFVDQGVRLPFFLRSWTHRHLISAATPTTTVITEDIDFSTPFGWLNYVLYPMLWLQFAYRIPIYKRRFGQQQK